MVGTNCSLPFRLERPTQEPSAFQYHCPLTHQGSPFEAEQNPSLSPNGCVPCHHPRIWTLGSTVFSSLQLICPWITKEATLEQPFWCGEYLMKWPDVGSRAGRVRGSIHTAILWLWEAEETTPRPPRYLRLSSGAHSPVVSCGADQLGLLIIFIHTISPFLGSVPVLLCQFSLSLNFLLAKLGIITMTRKRQMCKAHWLLSQRQQNCSCLLSYTFIQLSMMKAHMCPQKAAGHLLIVLKITTTASSSSQTHCFICHLRTLHLSLQNSLMPPTSTSPTLYRYKAFLRGNGDIIWIIITFQVSTENKSVLASSPPAEWKANYRSRKSSII